jgi:prepilin-type N-terminal cleavage/methylation domain-containing protein
MKAKWDTWRQKGFTLVELLVVIAIIGILATLVLLQLSSARARARDTQKIATINQMRSAIDQRYDDKGTYPDEGTFDETCATLKSDGYMTACPTGLTGMTYGVNGNKYQFAADLEATTKPAAMNADSDIDAGTTGGFVVGTAEDCATAAIDGDCIYDIGN